MMGWLRDVKAGLKGYAFESLVTRAAFVHFKRPVVTLTFDDVPRTALIDGLPILARRGVKSTFYVAMGLNAEEPGSFLNEVDVRYLAAEGHEIGCHTWSHYRLSEHQGNASGLAADATRNRDRLLEFTDGRYPRNFSFP
jgi:peptidoglycan/xylan/chitin deacetylase (PgdA/CDA1 family)